MKLAPLSSSLAERMLIVIVAMVLAAAVVSCPKPQKSVKVGADVSPEATETLVRFIEELGGPHETIDNLSATACRSCHLLQYEDWLGSTHANAMKGEAFQATLRHTVTLHGFEEARKCIACHAPVDLEAESVGTDGSIEPGSVASDGINCVACHTRDRVARIAGSEAGVPGTGRPGHCAACHNLAESILALLDPDFAGEYGIRKAAGRPYDEWVLGPYGQVGENNRQCLDCHGRNGTGTLHRWPKDKAEMVKSAYTIELIPFELDNESGEWVGGLSIANTGAGHGLPTGDPGHMITIEASLAIVDQEDADGDTETLGETSYALATFWEPGFGRSDRRLMPGEPADVLIRVAPDRAQEFKGDTMRIDYRVLYGFDEAASQVLQRLGIPLSPATVVEESSVEVPDLSG